MSTIRPGTSAMPPTTTPPLKTPDWVKDAVFYQVFPERFANGQPGNDPAGTVPWGTRPEVFQFQGGDLQGLDQRLGYIQQLGANSLYLNPIFTSPSNHKYDTVDYRHVDPHFGGDAAFDQLSNDLHGRNMRVVLDGVLNHTSNESAWFNDVKAKGPASPYWNWYTVTKWPITTWTDDKGVLRTKDYQAWGSPTVGGPYATLPELKNTNPEVVKELITGDDSVLRHWLKGGKVDGWRMDVADEVEPEFWKQARATIKADNPDAFLLAENWSNAGAMLQGDQFDSAMNYRYFQQPSVQFFAHKRIPATLFAKALENDYPREAKLAMFNVLDSHDTPRFITEAGGDWYRLRPAAIFQMTYQGAPVIYYGDEIGMEGGADPDSRRAFDWGIADNLQPTVPATVKAKGPATIAGREVSAQDRANQLFGLYHKLIDTRRNTEALRRGDFAMLTTHDLDNTLAFRRWVAGSDKDAVVVLNNAVSGRHVDVPVHSFAPDGTRYADALSGKAYTVAKGVLRVPNLDGNFGAVLLRV